GQIEIAVRVDIADIADRAHAAVRRTRLLGSLRVVEIFKLGSGLEPHRAGGAGRALLHVLVENMQIAEQHLADRAAVGQPFLAIASGEAETFGGTVIFVDDRPHPLITSPLTTARPGPAA